MMMASKIAALPLLQRGGPPRDPHTATKLLACMAHFGRSLNGRIARIADHELNHDDDDDDVRALLETQVRSVAWASEAVWRRGVGLARTRRERATIGAASCVALATCSDDLSTATAALDGAVLAAREARRDGDLDAETKKLVAAAYATVSKSWASRGDVREATRVARKWSAAAIKSKIAFGARPVEAAKLGSAIARAHSTAMSRGEAKEVLGRVRACAEQLPGSRAYSEEAIAACVLDAARRQHQSAGVLADAALETLAGREPSPCLEEAVLVARAASPGRLEAALAGAAAILSTSPEVAAALATGAVDEYKRVVDRGPQSSAENIEAARDAVRRALEAASRACAENEPAPGTRGRAKLWSNVGVIKARASAAIILGDQAGALAALEALPQRIAPAATRVVADARYARDLRKRSSPVPFLARVADLVARRDGPPPRRNKDRRIVQRFVVEVLRSAAFFAGFSRRASDDSDVASWGLAFARAAARGAFLVFPDDEVGARVATLAADGSSFLDADGANAVLDALLKADRRDEASDWLDAMRRERRYPAPTAGTYNVVLEDLARTAAHPDAVEDVLTTMANSDIVPNPRTVDHVLRFHARLGDAHAAVTAVQDAFNQHGVRPSPGEFVYFLATLLGSGDLHEARRAVYVLDQLWPPDALTGLRRNDMLSETELAGLFETYGGPGTRPR